MSATSTNPRRPAAAVRELVRPATRSDRVRQSLLAMLGDAADPLATLQLEAAHGAYSQYVYAQLTAMCRSGLVIRHHVLRTASGRMAYWWLPDRAGRLCVAPGCGQPGTGFLPPRLSVAWIRDAQGRLLWREVCELAGSGGWWACDRLEHTAFARASALRPLRGLGAAATQERSAR